MTYHFYGLDIECLHRPANPSADPPETLFDRIEKVILIGVVDLSHQGDIIKQTFPIWEYGDEEEDMLREAIEFILPPDVKPGSGERFEHIYVGYAIEHYDFPMLAERCAANGIGESAFSNLKELLDWPYLDIENISKHMMLERTGRKSWWGNKELIFGPGSTGQGAKIRGLFLAGRYPEILKYHMNELDTLYGWFNNEAKNIFR